MTDETPASEDTSPRAAPRFPSPVPRSRRPRRAATDGEEAPEKLHQTVDADRRRPVQEAHQGHRRPRRHRRAASTRSSANWSSTPTWPASGPARRRARSSNAASTRTSATRSRPRCCWPASNSSPRTTTSPRSAARTSTRPRSRCPNEGPLVYEFEVEVRPRVRPAQLQGPQAPRPVHTFTDEDVDQEERRLLAPLRPGRAQAGGQRPDRRLSSSPT